MAKITNQELVQAFQGYVKDKWGYVYGGQGELYTEALAKKYTSAGRNVPSGRNEATYFIKDCAKWYGHRVADCSGGIVYTIQQYDKTFTDRTANTFKSQFTKGGTISTIPEIPGLAVWRSGHIGVYEGNGNVLEFRGTDYGCVRTKLSERNFTRWGMIKGVEYITSETSKPTTNPSVQTTGKRVQVLGGSVNVRTAPNTSAKILGVARKGEEYALADNDWNYINFKGQYGWISGKTDLTKVLG